MSEHPSDNHKDSHDNPTADLVQTLTYTNGAVKQLEGFLVGYFQSQFAKGVAMPSELVSMSRVIYRALDRAQKQSAEITQQFQQLQDLVRASALISTSLELDQVLEDVVDNVISLTGAERAFLVLREPGKDEPVIRAPRNWDHESLLEHEVEFSRSILSAALNGSEPIITTNAQVDARFQSAQSIVRQGLRSILCLPLLIRGQAMGALYADSRIQQGIFHQEHIPILAAFGTQAAIAIEKARLHGEEIKQQRYAEELVVSRKIQLRLLPRNVPSIEGWTFAADYKAARMVGGDFYDFFELPRQPGILGVVIADVADKGVPAALFMTLSQTTIRTSASSVNSPALAMQNANDVIMQNSGSDLFLTAFYIMLDTQSGHVIYANAGHNHPLLLRAETGEIIPLSARGIILGVFEGIELETKEAFLDPNDVLLMYTDGVTEAMDSHEREYGEARLRAVLSAHCHQNAEEIKLAIAEDVKQFTGDASQFDDYTLVVIKREF